jgi:hypothetical protein
MTLEQLEKANEIKGYIDFLKDQIAFMQGESNTMNHRLTWAGHDRGVWIPKHIGNKIYNRILFECEKLLIEYKNELESI